MARIDFPDSNEEWSPQGMMKDLIDGLHHVRLAQTAIEAITKGKLAGNKEIIWKMKVLGGPSNGSGLWWSTPLSGYFDSKKNPGQRVPAWNFTRSVIAAFDPTCIDFKSFDPEVLIGKEAEINITTKKNNDGTISIWPDKVLWIRPWVNRDVVGPSVVNDPKTPSPHF
jgi:hypothetical protein